MVEILTNPHIIGAFYSFAGILHFVKPRVYIKAIPPYFPAPRTLNIIVGLAEVLIGLCYFIESLHTLAGIATILLLIAVFPAHIYTYQVGFMGIPRWIMIVRMPVQLFLIYWATLFISV